MDTRNIQPNIAHQVLAKLEDCGKLSAIVTQNIDGLHQKAGSKNVLEIHGQLKGVIVPSAMLNTAVATFSNREILFQGVQAAAV